LRPAQGFGPRARSAGVQVMSVVILDALEIVVESPVGGSLAHPDSGRVRKAEVNPQPDPGADDSPVQGPLGVVIAADSRNG